MKRGTKTCHKCNMVKCNLQGHQRDCIGNMDRKTEGPFYCDICGKVMKYYRSIRVHMYERHRPKRIYQCDLCSITFPRKQLFTDHTYTFHSDKTTLNCLICGFKTIHPKSFKQHNEKAKTTCSKCNKVVCNPKIHIRDCINRSDKSPCLICQKRFSNYQLKLHIAAVHETTKKCEKCDVILEHHQMRG